MTDLFYYLIKIISLFIKHNHLINNYKHIYIIKQIIIKIHHKNKIIS